MDQYLESLGLFYDEKVKFLSNKDNFIRCNDCPESKTFKETSEELILTCGEDKKKGKCGIQIRIKFPKYINYEKEINILKEKINDGINWESINNYIDVKDKIKDKKKKNIKYKEEIDKIVSAYNKANHDHKKDKIQKFYDNRINYIKQCKDLQYKLKRGDGDEKTKKSYMEEYIKNVKLMNEEYGEINKLINDLDSFLMDEKPTVKIFDENHLNENKSSKKKAEKKKAEKKKEEKKKEEKKPEKNKEQSIKYEEEMRVRWEKDGEFTYGTVSKEKGKRVLIIKDTGGKAMVEKKILEIVEEGEPEPEQENMSEEEEEEKPAINYFSGSKDYKWLSSFNKGKPFEFEGITYPTVEHAFHAQKIEKNHPVRDQYQTRIANEIDPKEAKKLGSKKSFESANLELRDDWESVKVNLMEELTRIYYMNNKKFMKKLIETGDAELVHKGFRIDGFWGVNKYASNNYHGKVLMVLRDEFKTLNIDFEEEEEEEEVEVDEKEDKKEKSEGPEDKKEGEINEGDNVTWTTKGKTFKGVVLKIDKRMKKNLNVMNSEGDIVKVKKSLLEVE
tara:strand:- start:1854 stop:3536 length:1683 start_codon:yes stop_codon:yes gene_type:complete